MLCMLCQGEKTVTEIEHFLGIQQAVVSQQLARLRSDKVVQTRREGRQIYYRIADPSIFELCDLVCGNIARQMEKSAGRRAAFTSLS